MIIGIIGKIGAGKTTCADYLKTKGFVEYSMAGPLKQIGEIFYFEPLQLYGSQEQKLEINKYWGISGREFLQKFGTEVCRRYMPIAIPKMNLNNTTIWVRLFEIEREKNPNVNYVISDVRFLDEAKSIKDQDGLLIRIKRDVIQDQSNHLHASEIEQDQIKEDISIDNNSDLESLYRSLDKCLEF